MKEYLLSVIAAALFAAMIWILSPAGSGKGISAHLRLACALFLLCILLSPLKNALSNVKNWINGGFEEALPPATDKEEYAHIMEEAMNASSKTYLSELLIHRLENEFSIPSGDVRCVMQWENANGARPVRVSIILSGNAIWRDPKDIEAYVEDLLGCECVSAIE